MQNTQTGIVDLDFAADVNQMVSVYGDVLVRPLKGTPGTVVKLYVFQYASGVVTFSGFTFEGGVAPELDPATGSSVTVYFACLGNNIFDELKRETTTP